ncbi:hypothetical protein M8J76_013335 [Diaphorina citri]|nr:hypothetical protein M8J76_013335 [Diaphorina citri]
MRDANGSSKARLDPKFKLVRPQFKQNRVKIRTIQREKGHPAYAGSKSKSSGKSPQSKNHNSSLKPR